MIEDPAVKDAALELQTIMLDMLRRRAVMEALEEKAMGKEMPVDILTIVASDYLRAHLSDLRKFFDRDTRTHRVADLVSKLPSGGDTSKQKHAALFDRWKAQYEEAANRYLFHREKGYTPPAGFSRADLDHFIDDVGLFLDELVRELTAANYSVAYVSRDTSYFQELKANARQFFEALR